MRTLNDYFLTAEIEDISTASSTFVAVPDGGKVIKILSVLSSILFNETVNGFKNLKSTLVVSLSLIT